VVSGSGDEGDVGAGGVLVGIGAVICGVEWATGSWVAGGVLGVSRCWLHPYSVKPTSAVAAAIWIFRDDFIFVIPFSKSAFVDEPHRTSLPGSSAAGPMIST
jgi:hypothetical protein